MTVNVDTLALQQLRITQRLRQRRLELGLTQKQVVDRLGLHGLRTTNRTLSSLEHGAGLEVAKLPALAEALDCTVTYLVALTDDPHRWEPDRAAESPPRPAHAAGNIPGAPSSLILGDDVPERGRHLSRLDGHTGRP
ncbi:MAG: helix-turn-helix transcriptional regulator [Pseudonocardiales bacterium]